MTKEWEGKWIAGLRRDGAGDGKREACAGEYLRIRVDSRFYHGGNQLWWSDREKKERKESKRVGRYQKCLRDENYRLAHLGCGVIAMNDLELFLRSQMAQGDFEASGSREENRPDLNRHDYMAYASRRWQNAYHINGDPLNYTTGLFPWKMERGLKRFLLENGIVPKKLRWAPKWHGKSSVLRAEVLELITGMLRENLPVVFSYHTFDKRDGLILYENMEQAIEKGGGNNPSVDSHYMTIIGLYEVRSKEDVNYLLQVVSWGKIYYVRYEDYSKKLNYFTNILAISMAK